MVSTAVILAAGLGSRLKGRTERMPKGLLELGGSTLMERSIGYLRDVGIKRILIGTGYLADTYKNLFAKQPDIECIENVDFANSGSMYTLFQMRKVLRESFLLLESDLLYEKRALRALLEDSHPDVVLASGTTNSGDEVYIETDNKAHLKQMSKNASELTSIYGELVGISKISPQCADLVFDFSERRFAGGNLRLDYEYVLVEASKKRPVHILKLEGLAWCEIDDENHLIRAHEKILPLVLAGSSS